MYIPRGVGSAGFLIGDGMSETIVTLKKGEGRTIKAGGAWIYDNEIDSIVGRFTNGDIVAVHDFDGYPMGRGFINQNSKIRIRMLTRKADQLIDEEFLRMRVQNAWDYRKVVMTGNGNTPSEKSDLSCCRVIFGEADFLPGLVVDRYGEVLVVECLALGMERLKNVVLRLLTKVMSTDGVEIRGIYERSDAPVRKKEGMMPHKGIIPMAEIMDSRMHSREGEAVAFGNSTVSDYEPTEEERHLFKNPIEIRENGVRYMVDVANGQKTGFFLDQKYNRLAMQRIVRGLCESKYPQSEFPKGKNNWETKKDNGGIRVLDCFTHMGTFALNCALAGATDVTGLDISEYAVSQATENAGLNGLSDRVRFRAANVLDELPKLYEAGEKYDVVILDPPAFTKSREATKNAIKGYREINMKGLKLVRDGGYFATCSCSHFMTQELFTETVAQAAKSVHKRLRQIEFRTQAPDHPILWAADESYYLKFLIFQVVEEK